jgi:hypothetical protein
VVVPRVGAGGGKQFLAQWLESYKIHVSSDGQCDMGLQILVMAMRARIFRIRPARGTRTFASGTDGQSPEISFTDRSLVQQRDHQPGWRRQLGGLFQPAAAAARSRGSGEPQTAPTSRLRPNTGKGSFSVRWCVRRKNHVSPDRQPHEPVLERRIAASCRACEGIEPDFLEMSSTSLSARSSAAVAAARDVSANGRRGIARNTAAINSASVHSTGATYAKRLRSANSEAALPVILCAPW